MNATYGLHWFRRDLRVAGNPALQWSFKRHEGRVLGVFCFDQKFLSRPDFSHARFQFFMESLKALRTELLEAGGDLLFLDVGPDEGFAQLFRRLKRTKGGLPQTVSWNRDYEPFAVARDARMEKWFQENEVTTHSESDHILIEPLEIKKDSDPQSPYQVFSPFQRKWLEVFETALVQERLAKQKKGLAYLNERAAKRIPKVFSLTWRKLLDEDAGALLEKYLSENRHHVSIAIPAAGSLAALERLRKFGKQVDRYADERDIPGVDGTSKISIYLKNGSLTIAQVIAALQLSGFGKKAKSGRHKFLSELIWREFYYYILFRYPHVENRAFQPRFNDIAWENNQSWFALWKEGKTGYPIIDAGMRELNTTGWMHNRVRMIVASFLTKDLLISWQWGERYFMEKLLDGDLAPNNGGWQWAASTGCDAQPYFRIFNPLLQSQKFDPKGDYIREYVSELRDVSADEIHAPLSATRRRVKYPEPLVVHSEQRDKALAAYGEKASHSK